MGAQLSQCTKNANKNTDNDMEELRRKSKSNGRDMEKKPISAATDNTDRAESLDTDKIPENEVHEVNEADKDSIPERKDTIVEISAVDDV